MKLSADSAVSLCVLALRWHWLVSLGWLLLLLTGCIVLPTPHVNTGEARRNLHPDTLAQFEPNKTTRTEVLLALGEPDAVSADERKLAYRSQKMVGLMLMGGYGTGAAAPLTKDDYLVCEFDARGRLVKAERSSHWLRSAALDQKIGSSGTVVQAHGKVRINTRASWLSGVDDYRTKGYAGAQWVEGRLILTESHLQFSSRGDFGNAPPVLSLPLRTITAATEDRIFIGSLLAIETRGGKNHAFQIWGNHKWTIDREKLSEILALLDRR